MRLRLLFPSARPSAARPASPGPDAAELLAIAGVVLLVTGVGLWSIPAACILGGVILLVAAFLLALSRPTPRRTR